MFELIEYFPKQNFRIYCISMVVTDPLKKNTLAEVMFPNGFVRAKQMK